jgi:hypothetical protein
VKKFLVLVVVLGVIYAGIGLVIANTGSDRWKSWVSAHYGVLGWPAMMFDMQSNSPTYQAYLEAPSGRTTEASSRVNSMLHSTELPEEGRRRVREVSSQLEHGAITTSEAERAVQQIGDAYLGQGRSERIMNIAKDAGTEKMSAREAADKIVDEVPTGLPDPTDKFVKGVSKRVAGRIEGGGR